MRMSKLVNKSKKEKGQAMVEFAIVLPLFLLIVCFLIDVSWVVYNKVQFDYSLRKMAIQLDLGPQQKHALHTNQSYIVDGGWANTHIRDMYEKNVEETGAPIDVSRVSIINSRIAVLAGKREFNYGVPDGTDKDRANSKFKTTTMEIASDVTYKVYPITPFSKPFLKDGVELKNNLYKIRRIELVGGKNQQW